MNNKKGFSIVGVLVAVFVSSVGMAAILSLVISSFSGAQVGKMRLIASGLAQEGIEIVRNDRRSTVGDDWGSWYEGVPSGDYKVEIKTDHSINVERPYPFPEPHLKFDLDTRLYQYTEGEDTPFYRKISLVNSGNYIEVTAEIKWKFKGNDHVLIVRDNLWNWK